MIFSKARVFGALSHSDSRIWCSLGAFLECSCVAFKTDQNLRQGMRTSRWAKALQVPKGNRQSTSALNGAHHQEPRTSEWHLGWWRPLHDGALLAPVGIFGRIKLIVLFSYLSDGCFLSDHALTVTSALRF